MPPDGPSLLDRLTGARETLALTDLLALAEHPIGMRALRLAGVAPTTRAPDWPTTSPRSAAC